MASAEELNTTVRQILKEPTLTPEEKNKLIAVIVNAERSNRKLYTAACGIENALSKASSIASRSDLTGEQAASTVHNLARHLSVLEATAKDPVINSGSSRFDPVDLESEL